MRTILFHFASPDLVLDQNPILFKCMFVIGGQMVNKICLTESIIYADIALWKHDNVALVVLE